jgi:Tol biopolymer transport system component
MIGKRASMILWMGGPVLAGVLAAAPARAGVVEAASHGALVATGAGSSFVALSVAPARAVSDDGRFTVFVSDSSDLVAGQVDTTSTQDVFLYDRATGAVTLVSHAGGSAVTTANAGSDLPAISADGAWVAFQSDATDLVAGGTDMNAASDVFLFSRATGEVTLVSRAAGSATTAGNAASSAASGVAISSGGAFVAFTSTASDLAAGLTTSGFENVFLFDRAAGSATLVSRSAAGATTAGNGASAQPTLSADGRYTAFASAATDLAAGQADTNNGTDVFLWDRSDGSLALVSHAAGAAATAGDAASDRPALSGDGNRVAFLSFAGDLLNGQADSAGSRDVFLYDQGSATTELVSHVDVATTTAAGGAGGRIALSRSGGSVVFSSAATDIAPGKTDTNGAEDVFLYNSAAMAVTLVSHTAASPFTAANSASTAPEISAVGDRVAFESTATDLVTGVPDSNAASDVFLYDPVSDENRLASRRASLPAAAGNAGSSGPMLSADGTTVAFSSDASDLVADDTNGLSDAFVFSTTLVGDFYTVAPCRLLDTRQASPGKPPVSGTALTLAAHGACGIPAEARALVVNLTAVLPSATGRLNLYPADLAAPVTSVLNFRAGDTRANNAVVRLETHGDGTLAILPVLADGEATVDVLVDVTGYFR